MTSELDTAIRRQWPDVDWTWEHGTFTRWSAGTPPTDAELQAALDAFRAERDAVEAERQRQHAADLQTLRTAAATDPRFAALLRVLGL